MGFKIRDRHGKTISFNSKAEFDRWVDNTDLSRGWSFSVEK